MFGSLLLLLLLSHFSNSQISFGEEEPIKDISCKTPEGLNGECINLSVCTPLLGLLNKQPVPPKVVQLLRESVCGFVDSLPDVCCPKTSTSVSTTTITTATPTTTAATTTAPTTTATTTPTHANSEARVELPSLSECGNSPFSEHSRIVGGTPSHLNGWPWIAALGYTNAQTNETKYLCGGTLISKRHILTAAHCVVRSDLKTVRLGEHNIASDDDGAHPEEYAVAERLFHSGYNSRFFDNDVGLLRLDRDVTFTPKISPICLPSASAPKVLALRFAGTTPFVAGWGTTEFRGATSDVLQEIQLTVMENVNCVKVFSNFTNVKITDTKLCARDPLEVKDACQGDSGGPMMQSLGSPGDGSGLNIAKWFQIGVVSFGYKCAVPGFPGVYTRVTDFSPWVTANLNKPYTSADLQA